MSIIKYRSKVKIRLNEMNFKPIKAVQK